MKSMLDLIKNSTTIILLIYSLITIVLMCIGLTTGKDIGYTEEIISATEADYVNGVTDGMEVCLDIIIRRTQNNQKYNIPL